MGRSSVVARMLDSQLGEPGLEQFNSLHVKTLIIIYIIENNNYYISYPKYDIVCVIEARACGIQAPLHMLP